MEEKLYNFSINLNWKLIAQLSKIDRFDASWAALEQREKQNLSQLKSFATIQSVGASTRIEGSKMNDDEVKSLIQNISISSITNRDSQEVTGYFNVLNIVIDSPNDIHIVKNTIKNLHNQLLKVSDKDSWHKGEYKQHSNAVEANFPDGSKQVIFRTTEPGFATEDAMDSLIKWYNEESETHNLIKVAVFV